MRKTHLLTPVDLRVKLNQFTLALLAYLEHEFSDELNQLILSLFPDLYKDASALQKRFGDYNPEKGIKMKDNEVYTLYIAYDILGRLFASNYREDVLKGFREHDPMNPETKEKLYQVALLNIAPQLQQTESYAAQTKSLKELPEVKKKLLKMPVFE